MCCLIKDRRARKKMPFNYKFWKNGRQLKISSYTLYKLKITQKSDKSSSNKCSQKLRNQNFSIFFSQKIRQIKTWYALFLNNVNNISRIIRLCENLKCCEIRIFNIFLTKKNRRNHGWLQYIKTFHGFSVFVP